MTKRLKNFRIIISTFGNLNEIKIKNLVINNKVKLKTFENIKVDGANIIKNDTELVIKPNNIIVTITYPEFLDLMAEYEFDSAIFIIILILSYLLSYQLLNYSAEFNTIQKKSKTEVIFITVFFIFLFIPMSYIDNREVSKQEYRTLAKLNPIIKSNG